MSRLGRFMPTTGGGPSPAGQVIELAKARFILKGTFYHPIKKAVVPLPTHQFYLLCASPTPVPPVFGYPSRSDGVSWIHFADDLRDEQAGSVWTLAWRPLVRGLGGAFRPGPDARHGEGWVDLDSMEWVSFRHARVVEKRRLLRLATWPGYLKAKQGGFGDAPPKTQFSKTGLLAYDEQELDVYGTPQQPWSVQVDYGLFQSFVRFNYYDLKEKKRKPVPPGLVVHAIGQRKLSGAATGNDSRVAAGTAIDDEGTVYMVHERAREHLGDFHYFFYTSTSGSSDHGVIDLSKESPKDRLSLVSADPSPKRDARYVLPREWHSMGTQAWTQEESGVPKRKAFQDVRYEKTKASEPLQFHLDDAVLTDPDGQPIAVKEDTRVTLLDYLLHIRDPDATKPYFWKTALEENYLRAEDAVVVDQEGIERVTRVVFREGTVHDLRERRVQAKDGTSFGRVPGIGLRAAVADGYDDHHQHVSYMDGNPSMPSFLDQPRGHSNHHLIDVSDDVKHTVDGKDVKLFHLLVWLPFIWNGSEAGQPIDDQYRFLDEAAIRWNQTHPAHPGEPGPDRVPAEFVLAPDGVISDGAKIVRVRHFFTEAPASYPGVVSLNVHPPTGARAGANLGEGLIDLYLQDIGPTPDAHWTAEPRQNQATSRFTLAHEIGHIIGWPDEYCEPHPSLGLEFSAWNQYPVDDAPCRPFYQDGPSMMTTNNKPRLRHYWQYANRVTAEPAFAQMLDPNAYYPINLALASGGALVLESPYDGLPEVNPYTAIASSYNIDPSNRCEATFYRVRTDEGAIERMYKKTTLEINRPMDRPYDGVLILRIRFMLDLEPSILNDSGKFQLVMNELNWLYHTRPPASLYAKQFVVDVSPPALAAGRSWDKPWLRRILIAFHPELDLANDYAARTPPQRVPSTGWHIYIRVVSARSGPHPLLSDTPPAQITVLPLEIDESILLHALGRPPYTEDPKTKARSMRTSLDVTDLQFVADDISKRLSDAPGIGRRVGDT